MSSTTPTKIEVEGKTREPFRIGVLAKGLVIVLLPMLFEFAFIVVLTGQIGQLEREVTRENHAKKILQLVGKLTELVYEVVMESGQLVHGDQEAAIKFKETVDQVVDDVPKYRLELKQLIKNNPQDMAAFAPIDRCYDRALAIFSEVTKSMGEGLEPRKALAKLSELRGERESLLNAYSGSLKQFIAHYRSIEKSSPEAQKRLRDQQKAVLLLGLLGNFLLAVGLVLYFSRSITDRLKIMTKNTVLLAKRQPLNPPISGTDEIAQLDKVFHQMAAELAEAALQKQEFMNTAAHDIRSPLTAIMGNLVLFNMGRLGTVPEEAKKKMEGTEANVRKLIELIGDLLEFDKLENLTAAGLSVKPERCEFLVDRAFQNTEAAAEEKEIELDMDIPDEEMRVLADKDRVVQVMTNLIANCISFGSQGAKLLVNVSPAGSDTEFSLTDKDREIPENLLPLAFERQRGELAGDVRKYFGKGLGLPLCKLIIEYHGGKIGVRKGEPSGVCFWFSLQSCPELETVAQEANS